MKKSNGFDWFAWDKLQLWSYQIFISIQKLFMWRHSSHFGLVSREMAALLKLLACKNIAGDLTVAILVWPNTKRWSYWMLVTMQKLFKWRHGSHVGFKIKETMAILDCISVRINNAHYVMVAMLRKQTIPSVLRSIFMQSPSFVSVMWETVFFCFGKKMIK